MHALLNIMLVLLAFDAVSTVFALERGGFYEANPALAGAIKRFGIEPAVILSHLAFAIWALMQWAWWTPEARAGVVAILAAVGVNNLSVLLKRRS